MATFPTTRIGGLEVSRMIIGTNNIMGGSHRTRARNLHIRSFNNEAKAVAEMIETYLAYGVDTIIGGLSDSTFALEGIQLAQEHAGKKVKFIELARFDTSDTNEAREKAKKYFKRCAEVGVDVCMPLHECTDRLMNKGERKINRIEDYLYMIRENGMIPGISGHMSEAVTFADENGYDCETYVQIYNASGFMMQEEVELVHRVIWNAKKPVLTIKPMAAGHLNPFVGLTFAWNTLRDKDMVAVGCMTPEEVHEAVEYSLAAIEHRCPDMEGKLY